LYYLARHAKRLQETGVSHIEKAVLLHELQLQRISDAASLPAMANQSFNEQSIVLAKQIKVLRLSKEGKGGIQKQLPPN
jgi:hypothetical protein